MSPSTILITETDRRRLGTMLLDPCLGRVERADRLHALELELERASSAAPERLPHDVVTMNSTVDLCSLESGETQTYTLVYPEQAEIAVDRLSVLAPVGIAILGCRVGDVVAVATPSGPRRIRVEAIHFQPERAGLHHL